MSGLRAGVALMPVIIYCRLCEYAHGSVGDLPVHCPGCKKKTKWGTSPPHMLMPTAVWKPTENDKRLLKAAHILAD